ncbi:Hsp20/alpha crystallin family protein [Solirubrobacter phytolaccae]|uniref:Hsp20/alpha crystallin family protein n=1 Tax=Solirubrobacter phytolaccae TaxID=1404360 RepID=A0A9X3SIX7_9ACTN|nr:Hsp20/alpha crystallin family protein [Solirubrobacter phytolaccae]MDA0184667.1 Hsp20/alpha crystallin family protein [Solirubrobacter phytolaccae]
MAIVRWEPFRDLSELNRLFAPTAGAQRRWLPAMDLAESADEFVLTADLPGLSDEDVKIEVEDRVLTISGERTSERTEGKGGYHRVERAFGSFRRTLTLPEGVDAEAITASFDRGVLELRIPKPEQRKPRRIEISTGGPKTLETSAA